MDITGGDAPPPHSPPGILVVDDHDLVRLGLRTLMQSHAADQGHDQPVLEARTLRDALALYAAQSDTIGLVLLDLHLPDAHGLSALGAFLQRFPAARVVVLSGTSDPALMRQALAMGARAYLAKSGNLETVITYVRSVGLCGPTAAPDAPAVAAATAPFTASVRDVHGQPLALSERQAQVLEWVLAGQSNRQIAQEASLSEGTVKNHVSALLLLFGVRSRAQLISHLR